MIHKQIEPMACGCRRYTFLCIYAMLLQIQPGNSFHSHAKHTLVEQIIDPGVCSEICLDLKLPGNLQRCWWQNCVFKFCCSLESSRIIAHILISKYNFFFWVRPTAYFQQTILLKNVSTVITIFRTCMFLLIFHGGTWWSKGYVLKFILHQNPNCNSIP